MRAAIRVAVLALLTTVISALPHSPATAGCGASGELTQVDATCEYSPGEVKEKYATAESDGFQYRIRLWCQTRVSDTQCAGSATPCADPPGSFRYELLRAPAGPNPSWTVIGDACLTPGDLGNLGTITPELVATEFRKLHWPKADLVVQPPGGETLVNFPTNFYTENTEPTQQQITLLGTRITIEATPTSYDWHFDGSKEDEDNEVTTQTPGGPYPTLDVTHEYLDAHVTVHPRVDVTYTGRYRLGGGAWTDIPDTLTVTGDPVELRVIEATPRLTYHDN